MNARILPPDCETLKKMVQQSIPDAKVEVGLYSGDDHFDMCVISNAFEGKNRVARHKLVYQALGDCMRTQIHALALKTLTPQEQE